jgi:group II intron reverse transcriptase/maturase
MLEEILGKENMTKAFKRVVANKGACGIDGMGVEELQPHMDKHWTKIKTKLLEGKYIPSAVREVEIPKPNGGKRKLGIPTVIDRLIQQAIAQELSKIYDKEFSPYSYGFRPGKSAHQAVKQAEVYVNEGSIYVVEIDLEKFFDKVNHDRLMQHLSRRIEDKRLLKLIRRYLSNGIMADGVVNRRTEGTPQGSPLSPLLSNIVLDELDKELESRGHKFVRYADDCSVYVQSMKAANRVLESLTEYIEEKLKLKVNREKSKVNPATRSSLLGLSFY